MLYFAYASSMNLEHMRRLCGWHFTVLGPALLENFELGPDLRGYINIKQKEGSKVYGVLYEIDQQGLSSLDEFEGVPTVFKREAFPVKDTDGETADAWVYIEGEEQFGGKFVKEGYLKRVIKAAEENRLPNEWIEYLSSLETEK